MAYVDFSQLKKQVSLEKVLDVYGIPTRKSGSQLRGACPICGTNANRAFVATPSENLWRCFGECDEGGDIISLVAKLKGIRPKEAALDIRETCLATPTKPQETAKEAVSELQPLDYLLAEHVAVQDLGIPPDVAEKLGCGYAKKGIMRGRVALPLRNPDGELVAYCGYSVKDNTLKLPKFEGT